MTIPARLHGGIVRLTPTTLWRWRECRRQYLLKNLLQVPETDRRPWTDEGLKVHDLLRHVHQGGSCADAPWVAEVVESHTVGDAESLRGFLARHAALCPGPGGAEALDHESDRARFHRGPPALVANARIDALWVHDRILDARDYKTGSRPPDDVSADLGARLQAWVLAPLAEARQLRLRVRYEYLGAETNEQPPPWDPEPDELEAVEADLVATVEAMRDERDYEGVRDPATCGGCAYRSVCVDAAVPAAIPAAAGAAAKITG